eukprot:12892076-Prorocentrum_lima.AAC.1
MRFSKASTHSTQPSQSSLPEVSDHCPLEARKGRSATNRNRRGNRGRPLKFQCATMVQIPFKSELDRAVCSA